MHDSFRYAAVALMAIAVALKPPEDAQADDPAPARTFALRVVGPDGQPASAVQVEFRGLKSLARELVLAGEFLEQARYGAICRTAADGELEIQLPAQVPHLEIHIQSRGYGPYCARWDDVLPAEFTAELDAAWTVGGVIVDADGHPVQGATVHPSLEFKKRPGNEFQLAIAITVPVGPANEPVDLGKIQLQ